MWLQLHPPNSTLNPFSITPHHQPHTEPITYAVQAPENHNANTTFAPAGLFFVFQTTVDGNDDDDKDDDDGDGHGDANPPQCSEARAVFLEWWHNKALK